MKKTGEFIFSEVFERIQKTTKIKRLSHLADFLGISNPSVSNIKKRGHFPADWAVRIELEYGVLTRWLLTGDGPQRIENGETLQDKTVLATEIPSDTPAFLRELETWGREYAGTGNLDWLENLLDTCLPAFKTWREQKKSGAETAPLHEDQITTRRVA